MPSPVSAFTARGTLLKTLGKLCELGLPFRNPEVIPEWDERREGSLVRAEAQGVTMAGGERGGQREVKS